MTRHLQSTIATLLAVLAVGTACSAGEIYIRLIDPVAKAPLEFWQNDVKLPGGGRMLLRFPTTVYVDGKPVDYERYGIQQTDGSSDVEAEKDNALDLGAELVKDLGGGAPPEPEIEADRKNEILGGDGPKAMAKLRVGGGAHVIHPGGQRFSIAGGEPQPDGDSLVKLNAISLGLVCYPVDLNMLPVPKVDRGGRLVVKSAGHVVFLEMLAAAAAARDTAAVVRLYLPLSAEPLEADVGEYGRIAFTIGKDGVKLQDGAKLADGVELAADGFELTFRDQSALAQVEPPPAARQPELYLFNDRNRLTYVEGERVEVSLRAYGPAAQAGTAALVLVGQATGDARERSSLDLPLQTDPKLPVGNVKLSPAGDGAAFAEFELDTALLRPGRYELRAEAGGTASNPLPLQIAPILPGTNMKIFSHIKWGDSSMRPEAIDRLANLGFNVLSNYAKETFGMGALEPGFRVFDGWNGRIPTDPDRFKEFQKTHFPPELLEGQMEIAGGMQQMTARGVEFLCVHFPLILYFNVGERWADHAEDRYQALQHLGMAARRFPCFAGLTYCTGDGPTPATMGSVWASAGVASFDVIHGERVQKLREVFEQKYGTISVDVSEAEKLNQPTEKDREEMGGRNAWGFKVGEEIKMKVSGADDKALLWSQWVNDLYPESFRTCRRLLGQMIPDPVLSCGTTWGFGAGGGMYPGTLYRALDFPLNDMHGDYGVCNFCYITGSDILTMGMEEPSGPPWIGLDMITVRERANGYKLLLEALSRNPAGVGVLNLSQGDWICAWAADKSRSEDLADLTEIARRVGPVFPRLQRQDEIAVVSSFRQEVLGGQPFRALWAAHYIASKAGYQAAIITDVFCETHPDRLARLYKAILLFGMTKPLSPEFRAALAAYQKAGGLIIDDASTAVDLPGVVKLPFAVPRSHGPSNSNDHLEFESFFIPLIKQFADTVRPHFAPFFAFESQLKIHNHEINFTGIRSTDGDLQYLTIFNDGKPNIENGTHAQFLYQGDKATVALPKPGVLYDALRRTAVTTKPAGDGMQFVCDATLYPGSVYVLADRPIAGLEVVCPWKAAPGEVVGFRVRTQDPDGKPFTGKLPIELTVRDPAGAIRYQVYRTTEQNIDLKLAGNDPPGKWSWTVVDQATGLRIERSFDVAGEVQPPAVTPIGELVFDANAVHDLLKQEVEIVLFPSDGPLQPAAEQLLADLRNRGVKASLRTLWPAEFRNYPMQWFYHTIEDVELRTGVLDGDLLGSRIEGKNHKGTYMRDSFGNYAFYKHYTGSAPLVYYRNVILLGRSDVPVSPMLGLIRRGRMLWRNPSPSFPAAGQGMVGYAWGPFHSGHDAIVLYGNDPAGLKNAAASIVKLAEAKNPPPHRFVPSAPRLAPENGQAFASMGCKQSKGEAASVRGGVKRESRSLLSPIYARQINDVVCDDAGRVLVHQAGEQADLALIDPAAKQARQFKLPDGFAPISAQAFAWHLGPGAGKLWPPDKMQPVGNDFITTTDWGIGRFDKAGKPVWICDPFPVFNNYNEVKFPRRVRNWLLSGDRSAVLVGFLNITPSQGEPTFFHRPDVTLLDVATGKTLWTAETYYGDFIALAKDGSRAVMLDLEDPFRHISPRTVPNKHRATGLVMFDRTGEKLFLPLKGPVDRLLVDDAATVALITYNDARRYASIVDLDKGTVVNYPYPRIDAGAAVAPDGSWLVIAYSDGAVHRIDRAGKLVWKAVLPESGVPGISPKDGSVTVVSAGGAATVIAADGTIAQTVDYGKSQVEPLKAAQEPPPRPLEPQAPAPFWQTPPQGIAKTELKGAPFAEPKTFTGSQKVTLSVPAMSANQTLLACFRYQLKDPADKLVVSMAHGDKPLTYWFPYHLRPWPAWIPMRFDAPRSVQLTFQSAGGVTLQDGRIVLLKTEDWTNVSPTPSPDSAGTDRFKIADNRNVPRVMVPNIYGQIGDPRVEQMAYGTKGTDVFKLFDVDVFTGTDLYEIEYPLNDWQPSTWERNLRGARIVMEYDRPRVMRALAIWEQPGDVPNESYALECCDKYEIDEKMTKELKADWKFVCGVRDNTDYFHLHAFPPTKAKVWRLTIVRTQARMQRLAEVELYEEAMESLFDLEGKEGEGMMNDE
ncbi:MAG TPA: hypothetical protein VM223_11005 [Planctomycetota bacterium]|nr:hypothetical protein [Planctomycetota bacterium]